MSSVASDAPRGQDPLPRLVNDTFVRAFWNPAIFEEAVGRLLDHGHRVIRLNATQWGHEDDLHRDIARALDFPDYYGRNLSALNDCLGDFGYGFTDRDGSALVLAFTGYDKFAAHCPHQAHAVLDIIAVLARRAALSGHRMCALIQSDDPDLYFEPVGATPVLWNDAEWLNSSRKRDPGPGDRR